MTDDGGRAVPGKGREARGAVGAANSHEPTPGKRTLLDGNRTLLGGAGRGQTTPATQNTGQSRQPIPYLDRIRSSFGRHDVSQVGAEIGGGAAEAGASLDARAFTIGEHVGFAEAPDLHTAAHEAAHVVQQRAGISLPGGIDQPGDAHERLADEVADAVVRGESAEPLLDRIVAGGSGTSPSLSIQRKPVAGGAAGPSGAPAPARQLPPGQHYRVAGDYAYLLDVAWYSEGAVEQNSRLVSVEKNLEILTYLRGSGMFGWATPASLAEAARTLGVPAHLKAPEITMRIGANVLAVIGLPPTSSAMVSRDGEGLRVAVRVETDEAPAGEMVVKGTTVDAVYRALETFTGMAIAKSSRVDSFSMQVGNGAVYRSVSNANLEDLFGAQAWSAWKTKRANPAGEAEAHAGATTLSVASELTDVERVRLTTWLTDNLGGAPAGSSPSALSREMLAMVDDVETGSLKRYRGHIVDYLRKHRVGTGAPMTTSSLRQAIDNAMANGMGAVEPHSDRKVDPFLPEAPSATLSYNQGLALDGDTVTFRIAFDFSTLHLGASQETGPFEQTQRALDFANRPWHADVQWVFDRIDRPMLYEVAQSHHDHNDISIARKLALNPMEHEGTWAVHAFVRTSHFPLVRLSTQIQIKSEGARMEDLRKDALGDMAQASQLQEEGGRFSGPLAFAPRSDNQRAEGRQREIARLAEVRDYLRKSPGGSADAIAAVEKQIERRREQDTKIAGDKLNGWRTFDVRATFLSKVDEVPSGSLDIYGAFKVDDNGMGVPLPTVMLRDQSRRFEQTEYTFKGVGTTFEEALADATKQLAKDYPRGRLALFTEEQDPTGQRSTGKTIGFERETFSTWKAVKEKVFHPLAQIAVATASAAVMIFVPPAAAAIPLLIETVYQTVQTADDLISRSQNGTLSSSMMAVDIGTLGLGVMPFLSMAKPVRTSARAMFALEIANLGGQGLLMAANVRETLGAMQAQDVAAIAQMYSELLEAEKTHQASDPRLAEQRAQIEARAHAVRQRLRDAISEVAGQQMLFMLPGHVFKAVQAGRHAIEQHDAGWAPSDLGTPVEETDWAGLHRELSGDEQSPTPKQSQPSQPPTARAVGGIPNSPSAAVDAADADTKKPAPTPEAMNRARGARIAESVEGATYRGDGVFTLTVGDEELAIRIRRTSGRTRVVREGNEFVLEVPRDIGEAALGHVVAEGLAEVRRTWATAGSSQVDGARTMPTKRTTEAIARAPVGANEDPKTRAHDGRQIEKPEKEGVEEAIARRSQPVAPMSGTGEKWATPADRKGVPEDVPLTAQEVRDVVTTKYKDTIDKFAKNREHTANPKYLAVMEKIRALGPNGAKTKAGDDLLKTYMRELDAISKEIVQSSGQDPDVELRLLYNVVEQDLMKKAWLPHVGQLPVEQQARLAHMWREEWKLMVRDLMTDANQKEALYLRDLAKSGDRRGGRFEDFYQTNLEKKDGNADAAHRATIASAFTSNAEVNIQKTGYADGIDAVKAKDMREKAAARDVKAELPSVRAANEEAIEKDRASKRPKVSDETTSVGANDQAATGAARQEGNQARRAEIHLADDKPATLQLTPEAQGLRNELDVLDQLRGKLENAKRSNASAEDQKVISDDIAGHQRALDAKLRDPKNKENLLDRSVVFALTREANAPGASKELKSFLSSNIDAVTAAQAYSRQGVDPVLRAKREVFEREIALAVLNEGPVKDAVDKNLQMLCDKARAYIEKSRPPGAERDEAFAMLGVEASGGYAGGVLTEASPDKKKPRNESANQANAATMVEVLSGGNARERMIAIGKFAELVASDAQNDPARLAAGSKSRADLDAGGTDFTEADAKAFQARLDQYNKDRGYDSKASNGSKAPDAKDFLKPVSSELGPDGRQVPYQQAKKQNMDTKLPGVFTRDAEDFMGRNLTQREASEAATGTTKGGEASPIARTTMTIAEAQAMGLNLSPREIRAAKEGKLPWIVGTTANVVDPQSAFIKSGTQASMPQKAGISGTTFRFMQASALLGGDVVQSRLAMIGALQAIDAHTFYEIANAAAGFGIPYDPSSPYTNLLPEPILRALAVKSGSTLDQLNGRAPSTNTPTNAQSVK